LLKTQESKSANAHTSHSALRRMDGKGMEGRIASHISEIALHL
jgi:hypothetical protein